MTTFLIADTHFGHKNVIEFESRPYYDIQDMNAELISAWNATVAVDDEVIIVGDFSLMSPARTLDLITQLNGHKILVRGNHDKDKVVNRLLEEGELEVCHDVGMRLMIGKVHSYVSHYPLQTGERPNIVNIHGHIHNQPSDQTNQFNVGIDSQLMKDYYDECNVPYGSPVPLAYIEKKVHLYNDKKSLTYHSDQLNP